MTKERLSQLIDKMFSDIKNINDTKGADYAPGKDALENFKVQSQKWGITKYQVWGIYAGKHMDAVATAVKSSGAGVPTRKGEPLRESIKDTILYMILLDALMEEDTAQTQELASTQVPVPDAFVNLPQNVRVQDPEYADAVTKKANQLLVDPAGYDEAYRKMLREQNQQHLHARGEYDPYEAQFEEIEKALAIPDRDTDEPLSAEGLKLVATKWFANDHEEKMYSITVGGKIHFIVQSLMDMRPGGGTRHFPRPKLIYRERLGWRTKDDFHKWGSYLSDILNDTPKSKEIH